MKESKIEILRAVDEQDVVTDLFAIKAGEKPDYFETTKAIAELIKNYRQDYDEEDEEICKKCIERLCNREDVSLHTYTIFLTDAITLYE